MQKQLFRIMTFGFGLVCVLGGGNAIAQTANPSEPKYQSNEKDGLYGDSTLGVDPMDLIHNYNLRVGRSAEEFQQDSGTQIQDSASEFKRIQQERMLQQRNDAMETEAR